MFLSAQVCSSLNLSNIRFKEIKIRMIGKHVALMHFAIPINERNENSVLALIVVKAVNKYKVMPPIIVLDVDGANHNIPIFFHTVFLAAWHGGVIEAKLIHFIHIHITHSPSLSFTLSIAHSSQIVKLIFRYVIFQKLKVGMVGEHGHAMVCAKIIIARDVNNIVMHAIAETIEEKEIMKAAIVLHFGVSPNGSAKVLRRLFAIEHGGLVKVKRGDFVSHSVHPFCFY